MPASKGGLYRGGKKRAAKAKAKGPKFGDVFGGKKPAPKKAKR